MGHALAFDKEAAEDQDTITLRELNYFLEHPHSIGLDNVKESLRNVVQIMWELKGYITGYAPQLLLHGDHSSMAVAGPIVAAQKKKKSDQELWDLLLKLEEMITRNFHSIFDYVTKHVVNLIDDIIDTIDNIDDEIESLEDHIENTNTPKEVAVKKLRSKKNKREKLVQFKKHIEHHEAELEEADTAEEVLEIHENVVEDLKEFKQSPDTFIAKKRQPNPFFPISQLAISLPKNNDTNNNDTYSSDYNYYTNKTEDNGESDTTGTSDDTSGGGDNEEDTKPPPPSIDF